MAAWFTSNFGIGVASSLAGAAILYLLQKVVIRARRHPVHAFWEGFGREAVIMTTEYAIESHEVGRWLPDPVDGIEFEHDDQLVAVRSTSGYFLSYGMSIALGDLLAYLRRELGSTVQVTGDKGHSRPRDGRSLVVLGSPANNRYLQNFMDELLPEHPLLGHFSWSVGEHGVSLTLPDGEVLTPRMNDDEDGIDFALVACLSLDQGKDTRLVIISGCNMWGTEAATKLLLDPQRIRLLPPVARNRPDGMAFVVKAWISRGLADRVELYRKRDGSITYDLKAARASEPRSTH
jgi:hypothetical protein